jgi:hypothetical protein
MDNLIKEINSIHDNTDLRILRGVINDRIKVLGSVIKYSLNRGDLVSVKSKNKTETGTIDKINRTRAVVNINGKLWNVPFSLMTKQQERE